MGRRAILARTRRLIGDLLVDRGRPDLERLAAISDPGRFLWAILPHAARTFSSCIALLPGPSARAAAVGYLYCRMLDTYEDLPRDPAEADASLAAFPARFGAGETAPEPAPPLGATMPLDARDATHVLLVRRAEMIDRCYLELDPGARRLVRELVQAMAAGMRWSSSLLARQGRVFESEEQVLRYCRHVLGEPVVFAARLLRLESAGAAPLPPELQADALSVGEMIQLANVTRDIEKDLRRGVAYDARLRGDLGRDAAAADDPALDERIRVVRADLLTLALRRAAAYRRLVTALVPRRWSLARAAGVLMMLFTDRWFRACAIAAGRPAWGRHRSGAFLLGSSLLAGASGRRASRILFRIESDFLRAAGGAWATEGRLPAPGSTA